MPKRLFGFTTHHSLRTEILLLVHVVVRFVVVLAKAANALSDASCDNWLRRASALLSSSGLGAANVAAISKAKLMGVERRMLTQKKSLRQE